MKFIVKLEEGCWLATWSGDPGRTCIEKSAKRYERYRGAKIALGRARRYREFADAEIVQVES